MRIHSKRVYTRSGCKDVTLEVNDGKIISIENGSVNPDIDYGNDRILPGIFDTHNHGTFGYSANGDENMSSDEIKACIKGYLKGLAAQGTVNVFPTVMGVRGIKELNELSKQENDGAKILGIHSEGPWLNRVGEKGIKTGWPEVDINVAKQMYEDSEGLLRLVALAPEIPGIDEVIKYFLSKGVTLAAAHSDNTYEGAMKGYDQGISVATHTGNVMTDMHHRDIGGLGTALLRDDVTCEVVCDSMHICNPMLQIYFKVKNYDRFMMISDCTPLSGASVGKYSMYDMEIHITPEGFVLTDTGRLMGSSQPVLFGIKNLVENVKVPMERVVEMASLNPCIKYGFSRTKGSIEISKDADFVVITDDYKAVATYSEGRKVFDREIDKDLLNKKFIESIRKC